MFDIKTRHPDSKVHGTNMGPIWGRQDPGGPHELCYLGNYTVACSSVSYWTML